MSQNDSFTECISPEAGRAAPVLRYVSMAHICLAVLTVLSGAFFWYKHREKIYLKRRHGLLVSMNALPIIANVITGSVYRVFLNIPDVRITACFAGNFFLTLVVPGVIIPQLTRIINFHYRVKLNSKLVELQASRAKETKDNNTRQEDSTFQSVTAGNGAPAVPVLFKESIISVDVESSVFSSYAEEYSQIRKLKYAAGTKFSLNLEGFLLLLSLSFSAFYAGLTCPVFGSDTCEFGFTSSLPALFVAIPFFLLGFWYYYLVYLTKKAPDLFHIKREIKVSFRFGWLAMFFLILSTIDPGDIQKIDSEENIKFKWVQMLDLVLLAMFVYIIHVQVYYAIQFEKDRYEHTTVTLQEFLDHAEGKKLLETFLQSDFSVENLKVYQLMKRWKDMFDTSSSYRSLTEAKNIFRYWFDKENPGAVGINCSAQQYNLIESGLRDNETLEKTFFDGMMTELYWLMENDSFARFMNTPEYEVFVGIKDPEVNSTDFEQNI